MVRYCLQPAHLRRTALIALVMGTAYTALNQLHVILGSGFNTVTMLRCLGNYALPLLVANLGLLAARPGGFRGGEVR